MTLEQILVDLAATAGAVAGICTILAHLPFMPPVWAERFARVALYASQAFSVNRRDTMPKDPAPKTPFLPLLTFALAWGCVVLFTLSGCRESVPPCDQAKLAGIVAVCAAKSQDCVNKGIPQDQCPSLADCDKQIEAACGAGK